MRKAIYSLVNLSNCSKKCASLGNLSNLLKKMCKAIYSLVNLSNLLTKMCKAYIVLYIQICLNKRPRLYSYVGLLIKFAQKIRKAIVLWTYQIFSKKCHGYCLIYLSNLLTKMSKAYVGLLIKFAKIIHNAIVLWSYQICSINLLQKV